MKITITEENVTELVLAGLKATMFKGGELPEGVVLDLPKTNRDGYATLDIPTLDFGTLIGRASITKVSEPAEMKDDKPVTNAKEAVEKLQEVAEKVEKKQNVSKPAKPPIEKNVTGEDKLPETKPTNIFKDAPNPDAKANNIAETNEENVPFEPDNKIPAAVKPDESNEPAPVKSNIFAALKQKR